MTDREKSAARVLRMYSRRYLTDLQSGNLSATMLPGDTRVEIEKAEKTLGICRGEPKFKKGSWVFYHGSSLRGESNGVEKRGIIRFVVSIDEGWWYEVSGEDGGMMREEDLRADG